MQLRLQCKSPAPTVLLAANPGQGCVSHGFTPGSWFKLSRIPCWTVLAGQCSCRRPPQVLVSPVEEEEVGAAQALVEFCYTGALPEGATTGMQGLLRMFRLADRLEVRAANRF